MYFVSQPEHILHRDLKPANILGVRRPSTGRYPLSRQKTKVQKKKTVKWLFLSSKAS